MMSIVSKMKTFFALEDEEYEYEEQYVEEEKVMFTGDFLFYGSIGRTDFPGGSNEAMYQSLKKILESTSPINFVLFGRRRYSLDLLNLYVPFGKYNVISSFL